MPPKLGKSSETQSSKAARARQYLSAGGVTREDSDDELGLEDLPWQWIYSQKSGNKARGGEEIVGARMGDFQCMVGDCVLLKAEGTNEAWIGLICNFEDDVEEDDKVANFMWFSTEKEIRNKQKKRADALPVCMNSVEPVYIQADLITERSLYYSLMGHKSSDLNQWQSQYCLRRDVQVQIPLGKSSPFIKRPWEDIHLPERLQYSHGYLYGRIHMGRHIPIFRRHTGPDWACSGSDQSYQEAQERC